MLKNALLGTLVLGLLLAGCGSNDDKKDDGAAGSGAGASAAGTNGGGGTSGSLATGGSGGGGGSAGGFNLTCDTTVTSVTTCGSETCPAVPASGGMYCLVNCCVNGKCGTQRAIEGDSPADTECAPPPTEDARCPKQMVQGREIAGCCTPDNQCGILDTLITMSCIANGDVPSFAGGPFPERACDDEGDAGTN